MSSRKIRYYDSSTNTTKTEKFTFDKSKRYKWNKTTGAIEEATTLAADELTIAGSKSALRRIGDLERNVSILASKAGVAGADNVDTDAVLKGTKQALHESDALRLSGQTLSLYKGNGSYESVTLPDTNTTYTAGTGLSLSGTQFINTAPDKTVTLTGSGATTVSGTYPNFTISSTDTNTNTTYSAGNGIGLSGTTFSVAAGNGLSQTTTGLQMSGSYTGTFTATGDICAYSDASLKTDIQGIDGALDKVSKVRGVNFTRKADGSRSTGVVAQEIAAVLPEAVHTDAEGTMMVAYGNLTGLLIEAIKELKDEVDYLKGLK